MKKFLTTTIATALFSCSAFAQQSLTPHTATIVPNLHRSISHWGESGAGSMNKTSTCTFDTINYLYNKAAVPAPNNTLQVLNMSNTAGGNAFGQWFPASQPITVSGFEFFAWQNVLPGGIIPLTCRIYNANVDSTPLGLPLSTVTINIDTTFGGGALTALRKIVNFSSPITISSTNGYVITIENPSTNNVLVVANNWAVTPPHGRSEWLSSVRFGMGWVRSYNVNVGTNVLNADFLLQPFVSFDLTADFLPSTLCNQGGGNTITFTNTSSPAIFERFYNVRVFQNIPQLSFMWNYGDHTGFFYSLQGSRTYFNRQTYTVTKTDTLIGWTRGCRDVKQIVINAAPLTPNSASSNSPVCQGGTLMLTCDTVAGATGYFWTGPNGFTSTQRNATLANFGAINQGIYQVRAISGQCSSMVATTTVSIISQPDVTSNTPLCVGQQLNLNVTAVPGATYTWTGPNGFTDITRTPVRNNVVLADGGVYSVNVQVPGCGSIGVFNVSVAVNAIPATPTASSNGPLCAGQNLILSASAVPGATYLWNGPNAFASNQQNPIRTNVQLTEAGTYNVIAIVNGCVSAVASTTLSINSVPPTPTIGSNSPLCVGQTISLTSTTVVGATYLWTGPAGFSSSQQNPIRDTAQLLHAGMYSLVATINGCASVPATTQVDVTVNTPTPTATNNGPICPGQTLQLAASPISGATYSWTGPNGFISQSQNPSILSVALADAGLYSVTAQSPGCGVSAAGTTNVQVTTLPPAPTITTNAPICNGQNLSLSASNITGATYEWTGPNGFVSTVQSPTISAANQLNAGTYAVVATVSGCGASAPGTIQVSVRNVPVPPSVTSNSPVCVSDTIRLFSVSNSTGPNRMFNWTGVNNFSSVLQNPSISNVSSMNEGTYQVTVTDSGCTSAPAFVSVSLRPVPATPVASNSGTTCELGNVQLFASTIAGASYVWTGPEGFSTNQQNPIVSSVELTQAGSYSVRSVVNGCLSNPASTNVVITPLPPTPNPTNNGPVCVGQNITLSTDAVANAIYSWTGPNGFTSTQRAPIINNVQTNNAGLYEVVVIRQNCVSRQGTIVVEVNTIPEAPVITSFPFDARICAGDSILLFASFLPGGSYEWRGPAGFGSTVQNPIIRNSTQAIGGAYFVKVSRFGCTSPERSVNVVVNRVPQTSTISGPTMVRNFEMQNYAVTGEPGSVYNWQVSGGVVESGGTSPNITVEWGASGGGQLRVVETSTDGCKGAERQLSVIIQNTTSLAENSLSAITLYPNPAVESVQLQLQESSLLPVEVAVYSMLGKKVYSTTVAVGETLHEIPVAQLPSGVYLFKIAQGQHEKTVKIQVHER